MASLAIQVRVSGAVYFGVLFMVRVTLGELRSIDLGALDVADAEQADVKAAVERCVSLHVGVGDREKLVVPESVAALIPIPPGAEGTDGAIGVDPVGDQSGDQSGEPGAAE